MDKLTDKSSKAHLEPKVSKPLRKDANFDITDKRKLIASKTFSLPFYSKYPGQEMQTETGCTIKRRNSDILSRKPKPNLPLKSASQLIGSKVSFFDKHDRILSGTLRWVGKNKVDGAEILGIEAVSSL